ncbi:MAG TPA: GTPase Era [Actinomycetota bacterium]|nr:GTPase Era [Actinomycetota bacterium]
MELSTGVSADREAAFRSGFVCLVGRPNVGKSTLLNRLVSTKVAIVSDKPQTTRHAVRGILTLPEAQIVFVDTPGLHRPRDALGRRLNDIAHQNLRDVDEIVFVLDASARIGAGDAFIARALVGIGTPVICVVTKADLVMPPKLLSQIEAARALGDWKEVLTTSSPRGTGISDLVRALVDGLPEGPQYYPPGSVSDQPQAIAVSEMVREKVLELLSEEVPHSIAVVVDEMEPGDSPDVLLVTASIYVERDSQKGIVIGRGGRMLKEIGTRARPEVEELLGSRVFLDLRVKVEPNWPRREGLVERFGY